MNYNKEFQQRFSELAREISTSNSELAQILDIDRKTLGNYINTDRALPSAENLIKISENAKVNAGKDVSVDWLLGLVPQSNPSSDEKIRTVAEYTGLCDDAIERLHELLTDDKRKSRIHFINLVLSNTNFYNAITRIQDACNFKEDFPEEGVYVMRKYKKTPLLIDRSILIGTATRHAIEYFKAVIDRIVEEA